VGLGRDSTGATAALASRVAWFFLFAIPVAVFATALTVTPDPVGHGTHTQLGLPPCGFILFTGLPCPGCGLTTSFAHMVRFDVVGACTANPFGLLLFFVSLSTAIIAAVGFVKGLPVIRTLDRFHAEKWAILLAMTSLTVWTVRVVTILTRI